MSDLEAGLSSKRDASGAPRRRVTVPDVPSVTCLQIVGNQLDPRPLVLDGRRDGLDVRGEARSAIREGKITSRLPLDVDELWDAVARVISDYEAAVRRPDGLEGRDCRSARACREVMHQQVR